MRYNTGMNSVQYGLLYVNINSVHLKQTSFWPSADVKPNLDDLMLLCLLSLYEYIKISMA